MNRPDKKECLRRLRDEEEKLQAAIDPQRRREYVEYIYGAFSDKQLRGFTERMEMMLEEYLRPEQRAEEEHMQWLRVDMLFCYFQYGCDFDEYFLYDFEGKTHLMRSQYVTQNRREGWYRKFNREDLHILYDDKGRTYESYKKFYRRECFTVRGPEDEQGFYDFLSRHPQFFAKDALGFCGQGVEKRSVQDIGDPAEYFRSLLKRVPVHLEEPIRQGKELAAIHRQSVNTVRMLTVTDRYGNIHIFECCLRMGCGDSVVDNYSAGGMIAVIDPDTGVSIGDGRDKRRRPRATHPDSGVRLRGFRLPDWQGLRAMLEELVKVVPEVRLYGWDFAWSEDGWILVEINQNPELNGQEDFGGGFLAAFNALL